MSFRFHNFKVLGEGAVFAFDFVYWFELLGEGGAGLFQVDEVYFHFVPFLSEFP